MVYNARIWGRCVRNPFLLVLLAATMVNALHDVVAERACDTSGPCSLNAADQLRNLCPRLLARALLRLLNDIAARGAALERLDLVGSLRVHPIESGPAASTACRNIFWHSLMAGSCCLVSISGKHRVRGGREEHLSCFADVRLLVGCELRVLANHGELLLARVDRLLGRLRPLICRLTLRLLNQHWLHICVILLLNLSGILLIAMEGQRQAVAAAFRTFLHSQGICHASDTQHRILLFSGRLGQLQQRVSPVHVVFLSGERSGRSRCIEQFLVLLRVKMLHAPALV